MTARPIALFGALLFIPVVACRDLIGGACDTGIVPGIVVEIHHSQTRAPLADSARGFVLEAAYSDSLWPHGYANTGQMLSRAAAYERAGTYSVLVTRAGYANWSQGNVRVTRGECHVHTVALVAALRPVP